DKPNEQADPKSVGRVILIEVANTIVNRAWEDKGYNGTAAKICSQICEKEFQAEKHDVIPTYAFRNGLIHQLTLLYDDREEMRATNIDYWVSFVQFQAGLFDLVKDSTGSGLTTITNILYDCLEDLAKPPCIHNSKEAVALWTILTSIGYNLSKDSPQRMQKLMVILRESFLSQKTNTKTRDILLNIIELNAGGWKMSSALESYYFNIIAL
ncbi:unnamed protein product, partial [Owenia fusiformis]